MKKKITANCKNSLAATPRPSNISDALSSNNSTNTKLLDQNNNDKTQPTQETLQVSLMYLMSKFALTQEKSYAEAVYQHLHMLAVRCDTNSKPRFLYRALAMDWLQVCRGQVAVNGSASTTGLN